MIFGGIAYQILSHLFSICESRLYSTPYNVSWDDPWNMLHGEGKMEYLVLSPGSGSKGTFTWTKKRKLSTKSAKQFYPNSEGILVRNHELFFVSKRKKRLFALDLDRGTYTYYSTVHGLFQGEPDQIVELTGSAGSPLYHTEDGSNYAGVHIRNRKGKTITILESHQYAAETTGLSFSPDGKRMYVAYQREGILFEITRDDGLSFRSTKV